MPNNIDGEERCFKYIKNKKKVLQEAVHYDYYLIKNLDSLCKLICGEANTEEIAAEPGE